MPGKVRSDILAAYGQTPRQWLFDLLTRPARPGDINIRADLLRTLSVGTHTLLFGATSLFLLVVALAMFDNPWIAAVLAGALVLTVLLRAWTLMKATAAGFDEISARHVVESGLLYAITASAIAIATALSQDLALIALASLVITGLVFGFCIANSGTPRFAQAQTLIVMLPFLMISALSGPPAMLMIFVQIPMWAGGIFMLIATSHSRLAGLIQAQTSNRYMAYHDPLTGLANRAEIMSTIAHTSRISAGIEPPPYVLFLDLDGFKGVNDTHGHAAGDALLRAVAERLQAAIRGSDLVGRIGGDEFVIVLHGLPAAQIPVLAERIAASISEPFMLPQAADVRIGVSIGGAPLGDDPERAMAEADAMLYSAKKTQRGTYRLSGLS